MTASETRTLLDPTSEQNRAMRERVARLASLDDATVGLLDISKPCGDIFLDRVQERLEERGARVLRYAKPTFAKVAPANLRGEIAEQCDAVIEALAD